MDVELWLCWLAVSLIWASLVFNEYFTKTPLFDFSK